MKNSASLGLRTMAVGNKNPISRRYSALSPRERQVMHLAAKGFPNKAIARELNVAEGTIKLHLHRVYQKLGIKSRFALAVLERELPSTPSGGHGDPSDAA
jgi:two-component system, NarL family, nitrate/nitrite response regulator NarL